MFRKILSGVMAAAVAISPAYATGTAQVTSAGPSETRAQITSFVGKVLVNHGAGFIPATGSMPLRLGDKVFVGPEASAAITYKADNCKIAAPAGRVLTVNLLSPCQDKTVQIQPTADLPEEAVAAAPAAFPWFFIKVFFARVGVKKHDDLLLRAITAPRFATIL